MSCQLAQAVTVSVHRCQYLQVLVLGVLFSIYPSRVLGASIVLASPQNGCPSRQPLTTSWSVVQLYASRRTSSRRHASGTAIQGARSTERTPFISPRQDDKNNMPNIALWSSLPRIPHSLR